MSEIKNIIFDLGGVVLNLNYDLTSSAFKKLGVKNFDDYYSQKEQVDLFNSFEKGLISSNEFILSAQKILPTYISKKDIINAWNSMLLNLPQKRLMLLQELKKSFRLFLLSNTNEIHIDFFEKQMQEAGQLETYYNCFEKIYYSSRINCRKPDKECFKYVLKESQLEPKETLFIDDSIQHIISARELGINTHHLQENENINTIFPDIIQSKPHS
ncbi:MAG: HAD family phosphatase [Flavobacteriales bacterium]|nr:HAD family phosphatase [Flavobacteriales bacterium]